MKEVSEIIRRVDDAFGAFMNAGLKESSAMADVISSFQEALQDTKMLIGDEAATLSAREAVDLINSLDVLCKHFLMMNSPERALEVFTVEYRLAEHVDPAKDGAGAVPAALNERLDELAAVASNEKQLDPFIEAVFEVRLGASPAAMALRSRLYALRARGLMRENALDAALQCLMEYYSSLADSVFQSDLQLDQTRLKVMRDIRRCLEAKGDRRLAGWLMRKMDIIKSRNRDGLEVLDWYRPKASPPLAGKGWPCAAFALEDAHEAYEHFQGYACVQHYGEGRPGHWLHAALEGYRYLGRCSRCGGFILVQRSVFDDDYYLDFFPVSGPAEAKSLNEKYDGDAIERAFPTKYLTINNGHIGWYDRRIRREAD